jgi:methanogenic corrinoid protein MtbC1
MSQASNPNSQIWVERLFEALTNGDRIQARLVVDAALRAETSAQDMLLNVYWPTHQLFEKLYRQDQMTKVSYHLGTRLLRSLVDQASGKLTLSPRNGQTIFAACGPSEGEELAGQMAADLLEAAGFEVSFAGGGIPADEIMEQVQERRPDFLVMFASAASDLPGIRGIIDQLREVNAVPNTKICVGGGVFARAEGLAEEMGCELCARDPMEIVELMTMPEVTQGDMGDLRITTRQLKPAKAKAPARIRNAA